MVIQRRDDNGPNDASPLSRYRSKRDFSATPEPPPPPRAPGARERGAEQQLRFVIHEHHARRLHWDLRLEHDGALASWAIPKGLPEAPGENRFAAATEDHPLEYLDFHGDIPKGQYGAGAMTIWDGGTYDVLKWQPRKVEVALHGERVDARYALFAIEQGEHPGDWMIHRMDPPADRGREPMPRRIVPMLARAGSLPTADAGWAYEIKWDGVRAICYSRPGELRLESRNGNDITERYGALRKLNAALSSHSAILDGELVAFDADGRASFQALQQGRPPTYMIFDLLWLDGHSLVGLPYEQRRELLEGLRLLGESWQTPDNFLGDGAQLLAATVEQGLEGVVAKRVDSPYQPGMRPGSWVKIKSSARQEFVVGGWMPGKGKRAHSVGALLLGVHEPDGALRYVGRVGSGFSDAELDRLARLLGGLARPTSPFAAGPKPPRDALFCEPEPVAEVRFTQWTAGGSIRHPVYVGLRDDKSADEVVREDAPGGGDTRAPRAGDGGGGGGGGGEALAIPSTGAKSATIDVGARRLKLSNLDKTIYPRARWTKRDVIDYYAAIAPVLLAHLQGRALTVKRWPDGVDGKSFFQKQSPGHRPPWVATATIDSHSKPIDYTLADDLATLVWLANLAALELHVPLARAATLHTPTALVFDLDPGAPATAIECCRVALTLHGTFAGVGLDSYVKTSGSKGLQVYVPLNRDDVSFADTKPLAKAVAELLEQAEPELVVSRMTKARREGKVLIDWSQNDEHKTTVCVYSLRAGQHPTVSTPLTWDEVRAALDGGDPSALVFEAPAVLARVAEHGDLFAPALSVVQRLPKF